MKMISAYVLTERCTNPRTSREDDVNNTLPDTPFAKRDDVTHKNTDNSRHAAATNTLKNLEHRSRQRFSTGTTRLLLSSAYTGSNELVNILREAAAQTAHAENSISRQQTTLAAKDIAQLAVQRLKRSQRQEIRRRNPAGQVESLKVAANLPITGDDDRLVRRGQKDLGQLCQFVAERGALIEQIESIHQSISRG